MLIRQTKNSEFAETERLTREAFWNVYSPGCSEHLILHKLRQSPQYVPQLDCVLEHEGKLVAHIAYAEGTLTDETGSTQPLLLFGPVSVLPKFQNRGFGGALICNTLEQAKRLGYAAVVITGSPAYYHRFGFESASAHGIFHKEFPQGEGSPFFMYKVLDVQKAQAFRGVYQDPPCYFVQADEVEAFDRAFPPKIREKRPGQLSE